MAGNSFGQIFRITSFGESHGTTIGVVIDGCPAGLDIDLEFVQAQLDRRKPGQSKITTQRKESDQAQFISGIFEGKTLGTPIAMLIANEDGRSKDYDEMKDKFRPSHADFTYQAKYGHRDHRGGGRSSARETAARVAAGAVAQLLLKRSGISVSAYVSQVGLIGVEKSYEQLDLSKAEENIVRCPDLEVAKKMIALIESVRKDGDTIGGTVSLVIRGAPAGLGEPVFDRLHADLGKAMLSINAAKGFEYGSGFSSIGMRGSEHNDSYFKNSKSEIKTKTNFSGGIQGGISNGMDIYCRIAFKPVATIMKEQETVTTEGKPTQISARGRHDPCVLPRAVPIVEAMAALVMVDHLLRARLAKVED
jgi:chorismate synthase